MICFWMLCLCLCLCRWCLHFLCNISPHSVCIPHGQHAAQPHTCTTQLPGGTPRYVLHVFLSLFITTCTCLDYPTLLLLCLYTLLMAVRHSLHIQTPCHTQHLPVSQTILPVLVQPAPVHSARLWHPSLVARTCTQASQQLAICMHASLCGALHMSQHHAIHDQ